MKQLKIKILMTIGLLAALLAGCARQPVAPLVSAWPVAVSQQTAVGEISEYRESHGLSGVTSDPILQSAAAAQAMAMARANVLSHTVAGTLEQRLAEHRLPPSAADENVSGGYDTLEAALAGWRKSPPHNANLLDPKMRRIGIGSAYAPDSRYRQYWSLILAN